MGRKIVYSKSKEKFGSDIQLLSRLPTSLCKAFDMA